VYQDILVKTPSIKTYSRNSIGRKLDRTRGFYLSLKNQNKEKEKHLFKI
jgi:hypothetical protein